jgi:hypothetical protein
MSVCRFIRLFVSKGRKNRLLTMHEARETDLELYLSVLTDCFFQRTSFRECDIRVTGLNIVALAF